MGFLSLTLSSCLIELVTNENFSGFPRSVLKVKTEY